MKALSLTQPWATLVRLGQKRFETRSWWTSYQGELAIHATQKLDRSFLTRRDVQDALGHFTVQPLGAIVALVHLEMVFPAGDVRREIEAAIEAAPSRAARVALEYELAFGDYSDGRWAYKLVGLQPLAEPVRCKGALSLWEVPGEVEELVRAQARAYGDIRVLG